MDPSTQAYNELRSRLMANLEAVHYDGPAQILEGVVIDLLMEVLLDSLKTCFGSKGSLQHIAMEAKTSSGLNPYKQVLLKGRIRRRIYGGSTRRMRELSGERLFEATMKTINEASNEDVDKFIEVSETEISGFVVSDYGTL